MKKQEGRCNFLSDIMGGMQDMVRVVDLEYGVIFSNDAMINTFDHIEGQKCFEQIGNKEVCDYCIAKLCVERGIISKKEIKVGIRTFSIVCSPIWNPEKEIYCSVQVFRDITEQKKMEKLIYEQYKKMKLDLEFVKQLQYSVLPENNTYNDALKVTSKYMPSEILGGDVYDIIEIDENNTGIYIADVSGHGFTASTLTMFLIQVIRNKTKQQKSHPIEIIGALLKSYKDLRIDEDRYISIFYGVYNKKTRELVFVNAGHNCMPILIRDRNVEEIKIKGMPICSIIDEPNQEVKRMDILKGDKLVLYTDGVSESYNKIENDYFGSKRIMDICKSDLDCVDDYLVEDIIRESRKFDSGIAKDDIAIMVAEFI